MREEEAQIRDPAFVKLDSQPFVSNEFIIAIIWMAFLWVVGCSNESASNDPLAVWRSPTASAEQRVDAVNKLIKPGTSRDSVEALLGTNRTWFFCHGPVVNLTTNAGNITSGNVEASSWILEYMIQGRTVYLEFEPSPSGMTQSQLEFIQAYCESTTNISNGITNVER